MSILPHDNASRNSGDTRRETDSLPTEAPMTDPSSTPTERIPGAESATETSESETNPYGFALPDSVITILAKIEEYALDKGLPYFDPKLQDGFDPQLHWPYDELYFRYDSCPSCTYEPLILEHLGGASTGISSLHCLVCDTNPHTLAEEFGITEEELMDSSVSVPNHVPEWFSDPDYVETSIEASAEERAEDVMPNFTHPNEAVNKAAREQWTREKAKELVVKARGTVGDVSLDELRERMKKGGDFILDRPVGIPAILGKGQQVLWAEGEGFLITGPQGVGKTTFAGELLFGLMGLQDTVLGLPVKTARRVLYLAMDRPAQIQRALGRLFGEENRDLLNENLVFWAGPPLKDLAQDPELLTQMAEAADADIVFVDSLKDAALGLSEDAVGAGWNRAQQALLASGRNIVVLHHIKKATDELPSINDVYGSTWITSGSGSVVMVTGKPGDPIVKFFHIKTPAEEVGPYELFHDQPEGTIRIHGEVNLVDLARGPGGITAKAAAVILYEVPTPNPATVEKARRLLDKLVVAGELYSPEAAAKTAKIYFAKGV